MIPERPSPAVEQRDEGLALADALLADGRPLSPLPAAAHARVKRRLEAALRQRAPRRPRWLSPAVIGAGLLVCGGAFGIALDRLVLKRPQAPSADEAGTVAQFGRRVRAGRAKSTAAKPPVEETGPAASLEPVTAPAPLPVVVAEPPSTLPLMAPSHAPAKRLAMRSVGADETHARPSLPTQAPAHFAPPAPVAPAAILPAPTPAPLPLPAASPVETIAPQAAPTPVGPPVADRLSEERLLAAAVRALRAQNDARSALSALDEYHARYPRGRLAVEANVLRVDTLMALDQRGEALRTLDGLDFARMPGGVERQVQRGELRASAGRWQEAIADFDGVLANAQARDDSAAERALWGRAQCRLHVGDQAGARADAIAYARRFPGGRFAAQAARILTGGE